MYGSAYEILKGCKNSNNILSSSKKKDGTRTTIYRDAREEILRYHFPLDQLDYTCSNCNTDNEYNKPTSNAELDSLVKELNTNKASTHDRIDGYLVKLQLCC